MSNTGNYYYLKLISDITITTQGSSEHLFNTIWRSYLDGDNHTITATTDKPIFKGVDEGELKNIILDVKGITPILNCENSTLENITVNGFVTGTQNDSCFVTYPKGKTTYNNITINASLEAAGGNTNYNAVFFGNVANATEINLSNAVFNGELHSGSAALIIANHNYGKYILKMNNVKNNGVIRAITNPNSMCSKFNPIVSITNDGTHTLSKYFIDGVEYKPSQILDIAPSYFGGSFVLGEIDPNLNLVVNEDKTISITPSLNLNVHHYVISVGIYAMSKTGGTHINRIEETLLQGETVTSSLKRLEFVDTTWVKNNPNATKVENENYIVYTLEGKEYYLLPSVETDTLKGTPKMTEMITITAYSKTTQVLFSKSI